MQVREGAAMAELHAFQQAAAAATIEETPRVTDPASNGAEAGTVTIYLDRKKVTVPLVPGETLLETARRAGLDPPFNCEAGNCGTCMARLEEGHATMRVNDALEEDEVAEGYILTCQGVPDTDSITVRYE
jgi:ferredoxin